MNSLPIRKLAVGALATGVLYAARKAGFHIGNQAATQDANLAIGWVIAYIVPDPRVQRLGKPALSLLGKLRVLSELADTNTTTTVPETATVPDEVPAAAATEADAPH